MPFIPSPNGTFKFATVNPRYFNKFDCDGKFRNIISKTEKSLATDINKALESLRGMNQVKPLFCIKSSFIVCFSEEIHVTLLLLTCILLGPYLKEALNTFVVGHWTVSRQISSRHLSVESKENLIFVTHEP